MNELPAKKLRAGVIARHLRHTHSMRRLVVCLTCGNAADALRGEGLNVAEIGQRGLVAPNKWLSVHDVARVWPGAFDATSGHLSLPLLTEVGQALHKYVRDFSVDISDYLRVPSGSGETAVALALAFPACKFTAVYDDSNPATTYSPHAPLNGLVALLCKVERLNTA